MHVLAPGKSNRSVGAIHYSFTTGSKGSDGGPRCGGVESQKQESAVGTVLERGLTTSAVFMVTNLVTKHFGFEEDWKNVGQMFEEWRKH